MCLAFAKESRGEALGADDQRAEPLMAERNPESPAEKERLMEEVCDRKNFEIAWKRKRTTKSSWNFFPDGILIRQSVRNCRRSLTKG